jgi:perosamine synthetase
MKIPQVQPWLEQEEAAAAAATVTENWITEGPKTQEFSNRLNQLFGVRFGVFAPNGTLALVLGLMALGIGPGDEVLVPDITFIGAANAVIMLGAKPVFVEVEPLTYQIDLRHPATLVTDRTRAIMPVHLYGTSCDLVAITVFARQHHLLIIEDAAQGIGVTFNGRPVGGWGDVGCFSFFAEKDHHHRRRRLRRLSGRRYLSASYAAS